MKVNSRPCFSPYDIKPLTRPFPRPASLDIAIAWLVLDSSFKSSLDSRISPSKSLAKDKAHFNQLADEIRSQMMSMQK